MKFVSALHIGLAFLCLVSGVRLTRTNCSQYNQWYGCQTGMGPNARQAWDDYTRLTPFTVFQLQCRERAHVTKKAYLGTVMMFHGFTSCQDMYSLLIAKLLDRGFSVLAPTLPGHGRKWTYIHGLLQDNNKDLPVDRRTYENFAVKMHSIMLKVYGQKVVFGISLGGTLAAYVRTLGNLGNYHRTFIGAPMIEVTPAMKKFLGLAFYNDWTGNFPLSWGAACEQERKDGRGGYCQFKPYNVRAIMDLGKVLMNRVKPDYRNNDGSLFIAWVWADNTVDSRKAEDLAFQFALSIRGPHACEIHGGVPHNFLNVEYRPTVTKWWGRELNEKVANYLSEGTLLPSTGDDWPRCQLDCTPTTCS